MHYIGNYGSWIENYWIVELLSCKGYARPKEWKPTSELEEEQYYNAEKAGYDLKATHFWLYDSTNVSFDIVPPWVEGKYHWWITKMMPGQFTPLHKDPDASNTACIRYWVPLLDYTPGHIFQYKNNVLLDYKAGDVYAYEDSSDIHGACNIGYLPRLVLQVTEYVN